MSTSTIRDTISIRKFRLLWALSILGVVAFGLIFAGRAHADSLGFSLITAPATGTDPSDISISVTDELTGATITDASVIVGDSIQDTTTRGQTGAQGQYVAKGALSKGPRAITVSKDGYSSLSIIGVQSAQVLVHLKALPSAAQVAKGATVLASGRMKAWPKLDSKTVTAGLIFKSMSATDLIHFATDSFISPLNDTIDIFGKREIPSNFVAPKQDVSVFFTKVHLDKQDYRLPIARGKKVLLTGVQGSIPVGDIISMAQGGKPTLDILNKLNFTRAGLTGAITADNDFKTDVDANQLLKIRHKVTPATPPFAADILVAAATDMDGTRTVLMPTDIKSAGKGGRVNSVNLAAPDDNVGVAHDVLTIAAADHGHRTTGIITDRAGANVSPGQFLPVDAISGSETLPSTVTLAPINTGLAAAVYESNDAALWYVYALPGAAVSQIPSSGLPPKAEVASYSILNLDFGKDFDSLNLAGEKVMTQLQRFARASATIGKQEETVQ